MKPAAASVPTRSARAARLFGVAAALGVFAAMVAACGGTDPTARPTSVAPVATATAAPTATAVPGESPQPAPTADSPASKTFEQEWQELIAAAQAEKEIVLVLGGSATRTYRPIFEGFGQKFGINVVISGGSGRAAADRLLAERSVGKYTVDLPITGSTTSNSRMIPAGALDPIPPLLFHPDVIDKSKWYGGKHWYADPEQQYVFSFSASVDNPPITARYNTNKVSQAEIDSIGSVFDYLNPKWADGKIVAIPPVVAGAGGTWYTNYVDPNIGPEWIERFIRDMKPFWTDDSRLITDGLAQGKFSWAIAIGSTTNDIDDLAARGLPLGRLQKKLKEPGTLGSTGSSNVISVANRPPHPNATKLLLNWLLSKEGQEFRQLNAATETDQSLREDVGPIGRVNPFEAREPGVIYSVPDADPELLGRREEAMAFAQRIYRESIRR